MPDDDLDFLRKPNGELDLGTTLADIRGFVAELEEDAHRRQWGSWRLEDTFLVNYRDGRQMYTISLEMMTGAEEIFDLIAQVHGKTWVDSASVT